MSSTPSWTLASVTSEAAAATDPAAGRSFWVQAARRFRRHRLAVAGLMVMAGLSGAALLAPVLAPYDPAALDPL
ncbi:MAG: ABC transporter permease, partial [Firmicutes bacterium]|nr:ABC transporter permease [Bacillota bacterium]